MTRLRKGDVLTHCFRPYPNAPSAPGGGVRDEVLAARERGVIFDIGHGGGSFGFGTTKAMLDAGFLPDAISSDVHCLSIEGPAFDLLVTMSKFLCLGVDLPTVVRAATVGAGRGGRSARSRHARGRAASAMPRSSRWRRATSPITMCSARRSRAIASWRREAS